MILITMALLGVDSKLMWVASKGGKNNFIDKTKGDQTLIL